MKYLKNQYHIIAIFLFTIGIVLFLFLAACTRTTLDYRGFALDANGRLFIGKSQKIDVYDKDGSIKYSVFSKVFARGYTFTIQEETLYVSTGSRSYKMSLTGDILEEYEENPPYTYNQLQRNKWRYMSNSGTEYSFRLLGRCSITDSDSNILWQEPIISSIVRVGLFSSVFFWIIMVASFALLNLKRWYPPKSV